MKFTKMILSVTLMVCGFLVVVAGINIDNPDANPKWAPVGAMQLTFPLLRGGSTSVYGNSNRIILFAGALDDAALGHPRLNDVWVLTHANGMGGTGTWSNLIPNGAADSPQVRYVHSAVYDAANNRMIIYGGCGGAVDLVGCFPIQNNVWVLSHANGLGGTPTWTQLFPTGGPPGDRQGHQAVYDPATNSMIVWAGQNGGGSFCDTYPDVWVLSNANGLGGTPNWTQLTTTGGPPPGQYDSTAVYDSSNNIMTVFGGWGTGTDCSTPTNAVWALSHANGTGGTPVWTNLVAQGATGSPANRAQHAAVYLPSTNTMTIFGGTDINGAFLGDTWVLSHANGLGGTPAWSQLHINGTVPVESSRWNSGVIDTVNNRMIMFGGGVGGTGNDGPLWTTWVLTHPNGP